MKIYESTDKLDKIVFGKLCNYDFINKFKIA